MGLCSRAGGCRLKKKNLLDTRNGRFLTLGLLYVSEGIPFGFTSVAMVAFMRQQGMVAERLGYAQVLYIDAAIALAVIGLIPFLRGRQDASQGATPLAPPPVPAPAAAVD